MSRRLRPGLSGLPRGRSLGRGATAGAAILLIAVAGFVLFGRAAAPDVPTAVVERGEFIDYVEVRGEIRPARSIVLSAPSHAGELQIVKLLPGGTPVRAGDVVVVFDGTTLQRTMQEKLSEVKQAEAEIEQGRAQARLAGEQNATALMKARYDVERARLDLGGKTEFMSRVEQERARLALEDAQQRLRETEETIEADRQAAEADAAIREHKRQKALYELEQAERGLTVLQLRAPADGMINILPNFRTGGFTGAQEFREGDRGWPGAAIAELPDLSSVHLQARIDEAERGRLSAGQQALVRVDAVPDTEFTATVHEIAVLARADFSAGWPPDRNFGLDLLIDGADPRLRPGMSATARIAADRLPDMPIVPAEAVFQQAGRPVVYVLRGSQFDEQVVEVARRGRSRAALGGGVEPGARVATTRPEPEMIRRRAS